MLTDETSVALDALRQAAQLEKDGRDFYLDMAQRTSDAAGQKTFRFLAAEEEKHLTFVEEQYEALQAGQGWRATRPSTGERIDLGRDLFPLPGAESSGQLQAGASDLDALAYALDIEGKNYELYRKAALSISDLAGRAVFELLAGEEQRHYDLLKESYEHLASTKAWPPADDERLYSVWDQDWLV